MTESRSTRPASQADPVLRSWDAAAIAAVLRAPAEPRVDLMHGEGMRYRLGNPPTTELENFPDAGAVKLTTSELAIRLVRQDPPVLAPETVIFVSTLDPEN